MKILLSPTRRLRDQIMNRRCAVDYDVPKRGGRAYQAHPADQHVDDRANSGITHEPGGIQCGRNSTLQFRHICQPRKLSRT